MIDNDDGNNDAEICTAYNAATEKIAELYDAVARSDFGDHLEVQIVACSVSATLNALAEVIAEHVGIPDNGLMVISTDDLLVSLREARARAEQN